MFISFTRKRIEAQKCLEKSCEGPRSSRLLLCTGLSHYIKSALALSSQVLKASNDGECTVSLSGMYFLVMSILFSQASGWVCCPLFVHLLLAGWIGVCPSPPEGGVIGNRFLLDHPSISLSLD